MSNYINISDDAQSLLAVITSNTDDNDTLEINVSQTDELAGATGEFGQNSTLRLFETTATTHCINVGLCKHH